ncbi:hypothetical protein BRC81_16105 [Halobacteriales archaeon QS_1_68_20]|nr:MAG: hypothetical protein BRC81_16105 [Halobacteriales archaeon QS_1_68_20]
MMATTHAFAGAAVALVTVLVAPDLTAAAVAGALAGGIFPDLDLYAGHRRTLHFPVYYWVPTVPALLGALVWPGPVTVAVAAFAVAAALHSAMEVLGGGLELRPWLGTSERAVYDHHRGRWLRPRRWVRYDGAPEDFLLGAAFAVPVVLVVDGPLQAVVIGAIAASGLYAVLRKHLPRFAAAVARYTPQSLADYVPERFTEG